RSISSIMTASSLGCRSSLCIFFNAPSTTEISTLSLHDALPISANALTMSPEKRMPPSAMRGMLWRSAAFAQSMIAEGGRTPQHRSEEHTSELQSPYDLVCRLLLEKKKKHLHRLGKT